MRIVELSDNERSIVEQITKADRHACHALRGKGKSHATLRRLSSTVLRSTIKNFRKI